MTVVEVSGGVARRSGDRGGGGGERRSMGGRGRVVGGDWWRYPANTSWQRIGDRRLCPVRGDLQPLHCAVSWQSPYADRVAIKPLSNVVFPFSSLSFAQCLFFLLLYRTKSYSWWNICFTARGCGCWCSIFMYRDLNVCDLACQRRAFKRTEIYL